MYIYMIEIYIYIHIYIFINIYVYIHLHAFKYIHIYLRIYINIYIYRYRPVLMECGVVEPLCSLARSEDIELEIQRYAVLAIASEYLSFICYIYIYICIFAEIYCTSYSN
jgi:hypothetical protein